MKKSPRNLSLIVFLLIELGLYLTFIIGEAGSFIDTGSINLIKYISIFINSVFMVTISDSEALRKKPTLFISLFLVLIADYFLLFKSGWYYYAGIGFFALVQICYLLYVNKPKWIIFQVLSGCLGGLIAWLVCRANPSLDMPISIVATFYYAMSLFNVISSMITLAKKRMIKENIFYLIGAIGLLLCDLNVGLNNLYDKTIFLVLIWAFYLPSQVAILLQCRKKVVRSTTNC